MSWGHERSLLAGICLLMILIPVKGSHIVQPRYQKRENAVSLPKISINIFDISKGVGALERNVQLTFLGGKIDVRGFP